MSAGDQQGIAMLIGIVAAVYSIVQVWKEAKRHGEYMKAIAFTVFIAPFIYLVVSLLALWLLP